MNRNGYIVTKGMIVHDVDTEKEYNIDKPASKRNLGAPKEKRGPRTIEL